MTEGFALHEIVTDASGRPCDYRYLDVNPAFERLMGKSRNEVIGRLKREVTPGEDEFWIRTYGGVTLGGPPARFEHCSPDSRRHWQVYAFSPARGSSPSCSPISPTGSGPRPLCAKARTSIERSWRPRRTPSFWPTCKGKSHSHRTESSNSTVRSRLKA